MGSVFDSLPPQLKCRIDHAFHQTMQFRAVVHPEGSYRAVRRNSNQKDNLGLGGRFHNAEWNSSSFTTDNRPPELPPQIPLSSIPSALQSLDLPPDDQQVLSVFQNAASGWTSSVEVDEMAGEGMVSRDDWRAICAILFEHHEGKCVDASETELTGHERNRDMEDQLSASGTDDDSGDEYVESPTAFSYRRRMNYKPTSISNRTPPENMSPRRQTCLEAFALFFPSVPMSDIANQHITIKDVQRVSMFLGEQIRANEARFVSFVSKYRSLLTLVSLLLSDEDGRDARNVFYFSRKVCRPCRFWQDDGGCETGLIKYSFI